MLKRLTKNGRQLTDANISCIFRKLDPRRYEIENINVLFKIKHLTDIYITLEIHNKFDVMTTVNFTDSYFAVDGTTSRVITEETYTEIQTLKFTMNCLNPNNI